MANSNKNEPENVIKRAIKAEIVQDEGPMFRMNGLILDSPSAIKSFLAGTGNLESSVFKSQSCYFEVLTKRSLKWG